jgi:hypothetical protein
MNCLAAPRMRHVKVFISELGDCHTKRDHLVVRTTLSGSMENTQWSKELGGVWVFNFEGSGGAMIRISDGRDIRKQFCSTSVLEQG